MGVALKLYVQLDPTHPAWLDPFGNQTAISWIICVVVCVVAFPRDDGEGGTVRLSLWNHPGDGIYGTYARCERIVRSAAQILKDEPYHYGLLMLAPALLLLAQVDLSHVRARYTSRQLHGCTQGCGGYAAQTFNNTLDIGRRRIQMSWLYKLAKYPGMYSANKHLSLAS